MVRASAFAVSRLIYSLNVVGCSIARSAVTAPPRIFFSRRATLRSSTARPGGCGASTRPACADGWPAGHEATAAIRHLIEGKAVVCELRGRDRYGRSIGLCRADGQDLGAAMVERGMARAFTRYGSDYVEQERAAIGARAGVHAHGCVYPWDWRAKQR